MKDILLIGGGGHCRSCIDVIEEEKKYNIAGIVDNNIPLGTDVLGYKIIGNDSDLEVLRSSYSYAFITVGQIKNASVRKKLFEFAVKLGFDVPRIVSPRAFVSRHATIDKGTIVMHDALINASASIGKNCIINTKTLIEHDATIKDHCHISTGAIINGSVLVGEESFIGSGTITHHNTSITNNCVISAGTIIKV